MLLPWDRMAWIQWICHTRPIIILLLKSSHTNTHNHIISIKILEKVFIFVTLPLSPSLPQSLILMLIMHWLIVLSNCWLLIFFVLSLLPMLLMVVLLLLFNLWKYLCLRDCSKDLWLIVCSSSGSQPAKDGLYFWSVEISFRDCAAVLFFFLLFSIGHHFGLWLLCL